MSKSEADRLDDLEILVSHQANMIDELNEVVVAQGDVIADLRRKLDVLTRRFVETESRLKDDIPIDKPPHW